MTMHSPVQKAVVRKLRCAVYTRKSSEEGLDMEFNSLDAQREACEAYVASQRAEGWVLVPDRYDDGGVSGATLERPGLKRLLRDVEAGLVDVVVCYKIDRLSRSLSDFSKLVDLFEAHQVTFVSITQSFNTTTSMGRLTLNILLSFAQFEREVIGERIRDKFAASRKRGIWMGGMVSLGYWVVNRKLVIHEAEAATVRMIFERFLKTGSGMQLSRALNAEGVISRSGKPFDKGMLYKILSNRIYVGEAVHKGTAYPGEHSPIVSRDLWDKVRAIIDENPRKIKKGWKAKPWGRGSTYLQQSAFMTSMVVSCARAFATSYGWPKLPAAYLNSFDAPEMELHERVLKLRNQLYAHTDSVNYPVKPYSSDLHSDVIHFHVFEMPYEDIEKLAGMCRKITRQCLADQVDIKAKYLNL